MKSEDIIYKIIQNANICIKKKLKYSCICYDIVYIDLFKKIIEKPLTIIPYKYIPTFYKNFVFETNIEGRVDHEFRIREGDVLVVGYFGELYKMDLKKDFEIYGSRRLFIPKQIPYFYIEVTQDFDDWITANSKNLTTNWEIVRADIGDYIVVIDNSLKCIRKKIFEQTYDVLVH